MKMPKRPWCNSPPKSVRVSLYRPTSDLKPGPPAGYSNKTDGSSNSDLIMGRQKSKILILIKDLDLGGAERLLVDSLPYLDRTRFDYQVAYMLPEADFLASSIEQTGLPVHCLGNIKKPTASTHTITPGGWSAASHLPFALLLLWRMQQKERFDLIHAHLPLTGVLARFVGRYFGIPVVYTEHSLQDRYHPITRRANALTFSWNRQVLAVSAEVMASITRSGLDRHTHVKMLLNGVPVEKIRAEGYSTNDLRTELNIPKDHLVVGTVATFRPPKRLDNWLEVAARIAGNRNDVTFLMVGDGPEAVKIEAKIEDLGLDNRICRPGFRPDGRRLIGLMDVYLMSSEFEGLPIALLEAMTLARPVVATSVGGIPEVVTSGREGFLTPAGAIDELTRYTMELLNNSTLRQQMGQRGAIRVETTFDITERVKLTESIYLHLLQSASKKAPGLA